MKLCTCEKCNYTFLYPILPQHCPDCGGSPIRTATENEKKEFKKNQETLREEIRTGLYAAVG